MIKRVNFQCYYEIPDRFTHVAINRDSSVVGFSHPPVRDNVMGIWVDSVDGSGGELLLFEKWENFCRKFDDLKDGMELLKQRQRRKREKNLRNPGTGSVQSDCGDGDAD